MSTVTLRVTDRDLARAAKEADRLSFLGLKKTDVIRIALGMGLSSLEKMKSPTFKPHQRAGRS